MIVYLLIIINQHTNKVQNLNKSKCSCFVSQVFTYRSLFHCNIRHRWFSFIFIPTKEMCTCHVGGAILICFATFCLCPSLCFTILVKRSISSLHFVSIHVYYMWQNHIAQRMLTRVNNYSHDRSYTIQNRIHTHTSCTFVAVWCRFNAGQLLECFGLSWLFSTLAFLKMLN